MGSPDVCINGPYVIKRLLRAATRTDITCQTPKTEHLNSRKMVNRFFSHTTASDVYLGLTVRLLDKDRHMLEKNQTECPVTGVAVLNVQSLVSNTNNKEIQVAKVRALIGCTT